MDETTRELSGDLASRAIARRAVEAAIRRAPSCRPDQSQLGVLVQVLVDGFELSASVRGFKVFSRVRLFGWSDPGIRQAGCRLHAVLFRALGVQAVAGQR